MFFARKLGESGLRLGPVVVNRVHPAELATVEGDDEAARLLRWLAERDRRGLVALRSLLSRRQRLVEVPLLPEEPADLATLGELAGRLDELLDGS
jgi:hypothetical protein